MRWFSMIDELQLLGFHFHPETVLIDMTEIAISENRQNQEFRHFSYFEGQITRPPFTYCFLQMDLERMFPADTNYSKYWFGYYVQTVEDETRNRTAAYCLGYTLRHEGAEFIPLAQGNFFRIVFAPDGELIPGECNAWKGFHHCTQKGLPESQQYGLAWAIPDVDFWPDEDPHNRNVPFNSDLLVAWGHMHQKRPVEFVDPASNRQRRRWAQRKKGKIPSPYFVLVTTQPKKVRSGKAASSGGKRAAPAYHLVRGHFLTHPIDHPLPQFAGKTFWIPDHARGGKEKGTINKGYYIRLD